MLVCTTCMVMSSEESFYLCGDSVSACVSLFKSVCLCVCVCVPFAF